MTATKSNEAISQAENYLLKEPGKNLGLDFPGLTGINIEFKLEAFRRTLSAEVMNREVIKKSQTLTVIPISHVDDFEGFCAEKNTNVVSDSWPKNATYILVERQDDGKATYRTMIGSKEMPGAGFEEKFMLRHSNDFGLAENTLDIKDLIKLNNQGTTDEKGPKYLLMVVE